MRISPYWNEPLYCHLSAVSGGCHAGEEIAVCIPGQSGWQFVSIIYTLNLSRFRTFWLQVSAAGEFPSDIMPKAACILWATQE
jgi:hypothetical protein